MVRTMPIHEVKDRLSRLIADLGETGDEVQITKHGRVVAVLSSPPPSGVILGAGVRPDGAVPDIDDLSWSSADLAEFDRAIDPSSPSSTSSTSPT